MTDDSQRGYTIERTFEAPRQIVWDAWTKPEHFAYWFGTSDVRMEDVRMDVREGGRWSATMIYGEHRIPWSGQFVEVDPPQRLVMELTDVEGGTEFDRYIVELTEQGDVTDMVLRQAGGHLTDEEYEEAKVGTNSFMDSMAQLVKDEVVKMRHDPGQES